MAAPRQLVTGIAMVSGWAVGSYWGFDGLNQVGQYACNSFISSSTTVVSRGYGGLGGYGGYGRLGYGYGGVGRVGGVGVGVAEVDRFGYGYGRGVGVARVGVAEVDRFGYGGFGRYGTDRYGVGWGRWGYPYGDRYGYRKYPPHYRYDDWRPVATPGGGFEMYEEGGCIEAPDAPCKPKYKKRLPPPVK